MSRTRAVSLYTNNLDLGLLSHGLTQAVEAGKRFSRFSKIYPFTSDNSASLFSKIDAQGKVVLTLSGAGDQIIHSYLGGAKQVIAFDINWFSLFYSELKIIALRRLDMSGFKAFLMYQRPDGEANRDVWDYRTYATSLRGQLSEPAKRFFDLAYTTFEGSGYQLRHSGLFMNNITDYHSRVRNNLYLQSERHYECARRQVAKRQVLLLQADVRNIGKEIERLGLPRQYDVIYLSNLANYAEDMFPGTEPLQSYFDLVIRPVLDLVAYSGVLCAAYLHNPQVIGERVASRSIFDRSKRTAIFALGETGIRQEIEIDGVIETKKDLLVLLRKL
jgi:hypothetical protein